MDQSISGAQLPQDILEGAGDIALFLFGSTKRRRKVYYLAEHNELPVFRLGPARLFARRSTLLRWINEQEHAGTHMGPGPVKVRVKGLRTEGSDRITCPTPFMVETALALAETRWRVDILFAAVTGVRASEQVALRWRHIDFDGGLVRIESRVDAYKDEDECKSAAGIRRVPLKPRLIEELRGWRRLTKYPAEDDMVFPGRWGGFRDHSAMTNRQWNPIRAILAERYPDEKVDTNWHALRHFAVSCWIATDVNWKKVQTWVGHADIAFTMNRYGHIFADGVDDTRVLESIRRIIG